MARSIEEIAQQILAEKATKSELNVYSNTSLTARWRAWVYVFAFVIYLHELIWDDIKAEIDEKARANLQGTPLWYSEQILRYQHGDAVELIDGFPQYAVLDETKQVIKRASVNNTATPGLIEVKIAKLDGSGNPMPVSTPELDGVKSYLLNNIAYAGTAIEFINEAGDVVDVTATIYFDAQYPEADTKTAIELAIKTYLYTIKFDGLYFVQRLTDAIQAVPGVVDVLINAVTITDYTAAVTTNPQSLRFAAGYGVPGVINLTMNQI